MLQPEEFGSLGCVKEAHGGGHTEIRKRALRGGDVGVGEGGQRVAFLILQRTVSAGTRICSRVVSSFKNSAGKHFLKRNTYRE